MGLNIQYEDGQSPLDEDEKEGLLILSISTRQELDELEQQNIQQAMLWTTTRQRKFTVEEVFSEKLVRELHHRMLGEVWEWAGRFRNSNKNIGIDKHEIAVALQQLLEDIKYWITNKTYSPDEIAIRAKHRIVSIHCFANGNGRHSRLYADLIIERIFSEAQFSWGQYNPLQTGEVRDKYLRALRAADKGDYKPLLDFARS